MPINNLEIEAIINNPKLSNKVALDEVSSLYMTEGYLVTLRTDTQLQLIRKKQFSLLWAVLWTFLFGIGLLVYIFYYISKKDEQVNITLEEDNKNSSAIEDLTKLSQLLKDGHLTNEEFESQKKLLLS